MPRKKKPIEGAKRRRQKFPWRRLIGITAALALIAAAWFWLSLPSAEPLRRTFPKTTALMDARAARAKGKPGRAYRPVSIERISPWLVRAVVNSEDARFFLHHGLDVVETRAAVEKAMEDGRLGRGASTLTQQLAKNLWLGEERSLLRKARELVLAQRLEELGKERVLELYLSVVEWGEGIWGAEAAARTWFGVDAAQLGPAESAILAAMLPAPRKRSPKRPSARLKARAGQVLELFGAYHQLPLDELVRERARLKTLLGGPAPKPPPPPPPEQREPEPDDPDGEGVDDGAAPE